MCLNSEWEVGSSHFPGDSEKLRLVTGTEKHITNRTGQEVPWDNSFRKKGGREKEARRKGKCPDYSSLSMV